MLLLTTNVTKALVICLLVDLTQNERIIQHTHNPVKIFDSPFHTG
jgi:hypothetical protein